MSKSPTVRYNAASANEAPPNLCTSHGLGLLLGDVTLVGQISDAEAVELGGLLMETASGSSLVLVDGCCCWVKKAALFTDEVEVTTPFWVEGMKAAAVTKGAARKMDLWRRIVYCLIYLYLMCKCVLFRIDFVSRPMKTMQSMATNNYLDCDLWLK